MIACRRRVASLALLLVSSLGAGACAPPKKPVALDPRYDASMSPRDAFDRYWADLKQDPTNDVARANVIRLARTLQPPPAVAPEVDELAGKGAAILGDAASPADFQRAADAFRQAIAIAPWVGDFYYDLGDIEEKAGDATQARWAYRFYLLASPDGDDAAAVRRKIGEMDVASEKQEARRTKFARLDGERWFAPGEFGKLTMRKGVLIWYGKKGVGRSYKARIPLGPLDETTMSLDVAPAVLQEQFPAIADWHLELGADGAFHTTYTSRLVTVQGRQSQAYARQPFHPIVYVGAQYSGPVAFTGTLSTFDPVSGQTISRQRVDGTISAGGAATVGFAADSGRRGRFENGFFVAGEPMTFRIATSRFTGGVVTSSKAYAAYDLDAALGWELGLTDRDAPFRATTLLAGNMQFEAPFGLQTRASNGDKQAVNTVELLPMLEAGVFLQDVVLVKADIALHPIGEFHVWKQGPRLTAAYVVRF